MADTESLSLEERCSTECHGTKCGGDKKQDEYSKDSNAATIKSAAMEDDLPAINLGTRREAEVQ